MRAIIQIVACSNPVTGIQCALVAGAMAKAAGGSMRDVLKAMAFSYIVRGVWNGVKSTLESVGMATNFLVKGLVHGVVGGALSVAQGGNFMQGFASNAIGAVAGLAADGLDIFEHTIVVAAAGCASAVVSGGKCANGAMTAAFANLYNFWHIVAVVGVQAARLGYKCLRSRACREYIKEYAGLSKKGKNVGRNNKGSAHGQHGYWIRDRWNNNARVKVGIADNKYYDKIRRISFRALVQVRRWNRMNGPHYGGGQDRYFHEVVRVFRAGAGARLRAITWERSTAARLYRINEINTFLHKRPL